MAVRRDNWRVRIFLALMIVSLPACREQAPPAPSREQSAQLNEMEDSLNGLADNKEGPEANASDPSNGSN
jgi:hypothetical protein